MVQDRGESIIASMQRIYPRLLRYTWRYKHWLALAIVGMVSYAGSDVMLVYLVKPLLDGSIVERDPFLITWIPIFLLVLFIIRGLGGFLSRYGMAWVAKAVVFDVRGDIFARYLQLPNTFFDRNSTGKTTAKLTYYTEQISSAATSALTTVMQDGVRVLGFLGLMLYLNWSLTLITLIAGPIIAWLTSHISRRFRRYSARIQHSMGDITSISEEVLTGQRVVKIFGGKARETENFHRANERNRRMSMRKEATQAASVPIIQIIAALAVAGIVALVLNDSGNNLMTPGELAAFFGAMMGMMGPIKRLTQVNAQIQAGMAAADEIFAFLDLPGEPDAGTRPLQRAQGHIEIKHLYFSYPGTQHAVLCDINVEIQPGETVAFVGRSGSGKSTLLSLLPRFYEIEHGSLHLDGHPVTAYPLADLRNQISLVEQNVVLFNDTVARNIAYGSLGSADRAAIEDAAERAHAAEFIRALADGFDTEVGQ
ncbi:MAG TPA: ABC transporter transmembrane domain-containing protein, partial [Salinisphaeraceae bacterium]|nr:ABC transporter transmembrane domain-containing protein [Salinisphaeraceae bacterium]